MDEHWSETKDRNREHDVRLQEAIAVSVDERDGCIVGDGDLFRRNADELAILLVGSIDRQEALSLASLQQQPEVGERSKAGTGDIVQTPALEVRAHEIGEGQAHDEIWCVFEREQHRNRDWRLGPGNGDGKEKNKERRNEVMPGRSPRRWG